MWQPLHDIPQLAFRFHDNIRNTICNVNGLFAGSSEFIAPPERHTPAFCEAAFSHLKPLNTDSPIISVWHSLLPALNRGLRSSKNSRIIIIDFQGLYKSQYHEYPGLHQAESIIVQLNKQDNTEKIRGYRGRSEWLVWGAIRREFFLADFSIDSLRLHMVENPALGAILSLGSIEDASNARAYHEVINVSEVEMSNATGCSIGLFMAFIGLRRPFIHELATHIALVWKFRGREVLWRHQSYLNGVYLGYEFCPRADHPVNDS